MRGRSTLALDRVDAFFQVPDRIHNIPLWEENCRKIHARAADFISGRTSLMEAASEISRLAAWTQAEDDPDLATFRGALNASIGLPTGPERQFWSEEALTRVAPLIQSWEVNWKPIALEAAARLVQKYRWALAARQRRRKTGHAV